MKKVFTSFLWTIVMATVWVTLASPAFSQQLKMSLPEVAQRSGVILHVQAESGESVWVYGNAGKNIITTTRFRVLDCIRGNLAVNSPFNLAMPGGTIGDTTQFVTSSVEFSQGEECILFLQNNAVSLTGGFQGKYTVTDGKVFVENQVIKTERFVQALRESNRDATAIPALLRSLKTEPFAPAGRSLKSGNSTNGINDTYTVTGLKAAFTGSSDGDGDGYFSSFTFLIRVNGDADPGPVTVYFRITCTTTGQVWTSSNSFIITGTEVDNKNFAFSEADFAGLITGNMELNFTVDMMDNTQSNVLATNASIGGDAIKVDEATAGSITITSISPDMASSGTNSQVTLSGNTFGASQGTGKVNFFYRSGQPKISGTIVSWSDTQIVCTVPIGTVNGYSASAGSGPVTVTNNAGQTSNEYPFKVTYSVGGPKWGTAVVSYRINENLGSVSTEATDIMNAASSWNLTGANLNYNYVGSTTNTAPALNSNNDICWGTLDGSTIGQASMWSSGNTLVECDIVFNSGVSWNSGASGMDVESVALHEFGHWLNLRDLYGASSDGVYDQGKAMYGLISYGQEKRNLHYDDAAGMLHIYGAAVTYLISGYVKTGAGVAISNVILNGLPGNPSTNISGLYSANVTSGWSGTVSPAKTGYTFTPASRTYTNQAADATAQDYTGQTGSADATLSDLKVNGTTVSGFAPTTLTYAVTLPVGTVTMPVVTATTTDAGATKLITQAVALPGSATVRVTATDGTTIKTYTLNFTVTRNNDATLSDLKIAGTTVGGFSKTVFTYNITLPSGTSAVPTVTATTTDANASRVITPASSLPGSTTVLVTAENGTTTQTYTINFTVQAASNDATLSDLKVNGVTVTGFAPGTLAYDILLPIGTVTLPVVTATTNDSGAAKLITQALALPGSATVRVTAADGTTIKTYTVNFTVAKNNDATLSDLKVSGTTVSGFSRTVFNYTVTVPYGTSTVPTVTATTTDANASRVITAASALPGATTILVTAENGSSTQTYTVNFSVESASNDATLSDLKVNGVTVTGFASGTLSYEISLPFGAVAVPTVTATTTHTSATKLITSAASLPGTTLVRVTAQDGITVKIYSLNFTVAKNNDASLSDLKVSGTTITGFSSTVLTYTQMLPFGTVVVPTVTATTSDANASRVITPASSLPGATTILVTAENGTNTRIYTINFTVEAGSTDATLSNIWINGLALAGFNPQVTVYDDILEHETNLVPTITAATTSTFATKVITPATSLPGNTTIVVTSQSGTATKTYTIYFELDEDDNAALTDIRVNGTSIPGFQSDHLVYSLVLIGGTTCPPAVEVTLSDPNASVDIICPGTYPATVEINVTAEDQVTIAHYQIMVSYDLSGVNDHPVMNTLQVYPNPNLGNFTLDYTTSGSNRIRVSILDLTGREIFDRWYEGSIYRLTEPIQLSAAKQGFYLIRVIDGLAVTYQKLIVE